MPDTKNYSLRVKVLDGLLRTREGVTIHEMLQVVNERLEERGIRPVRTKDTILKDITEMANESSAFGTLQRIPRTEMGSGSLQQHGCTFEWKAGTCP